MALYSHHACRVGLGDRRMTKRASPHSGLRPGNRIGRWTIIAPAPAPRSRPGRVRSRWLCRCECGSEKVVLAQSLALAMRSSSGGSRSCGCLAVMRATRHSHAAGGRPTPEYMAWSAAKKRCENPRNASYANYGARGISMCPAWSQNFEVFLRDIGPRSSPAHSLDRINPDGDYEPDNCRWALPDVQARNRRVTRWYLFEGDQLVLAQVAARLSITRDQARALERRCELPAWRIPGVGANRVDTASGSFLDLNDVPTTCEGACP